MKKLISLVLCMVLVVSLSATAFAADFAPSKSLEKDTVTEVKPVDENGNAIDVVIKVVAPEVTTGDRQAFKNKKDPMVMVTGVDMAMAALEKEGDKAKDDKITDTGLTVAENKVLAETFKVVQETKTTSELLEKAGIKAEDVAKVLPAGTKADDFVPAAMFHVGMNDAAVKAIGEKGKVSMKVAVAGVKAGDTVLVVKLAADGTIIEGEFLEATVNADGTVSFDMVGSGPVLVLVNPAK